MIEQDNKNQRDYKYPFNLLDDCHVQYDETQKWEVFEIDARELLSHLRFDLFANLFYLRALDIKGGEKFAREVYRARTAAITGFKNSEPGNSEKNSFDDFVRIFEGLFQNIKENGFDDKQSLVPIDRNNILVDGAHRVSIAAYLGKKVKVCKLYQEFNKPLTVPYEFFQRAGIPQVYMDAMATEYCQWHKNIHMVFFWPKSYDSPKKKKADKILEENVNVVYRKQLKLSYNAVRNLILQIYHHVPWMGTVDDGFKWSYTKADEEYYGDGSMEVALVEDLQGLEHITALKAQLRDVFQLGLESVHSTDTYEEAKLAANLLFNENSLHLLDKGKPDLFPHSFKLIMEFRKAVIDSGCSLDDYIVDSSMVMALYGIREAKDLDYLRLKTAKDPIIIENNDKHIENNDKHIENHDKHIEELIINPKNHLVFMGVKVLSLENLSSFKASRGENKDLKDVRLMKPYLREGGRWQQRIDRWNLTWRVFKRNAKMKIVDSAVNLLNKTRLYNTVRSIYRFIKRK